MRLKQKTAIITGAATGIGKATAELFAKNGANIVIADIDELNGKHTAETINEFGAKAIFVKLDVTQENEWKKVVQETVEHFGKIDILFNNAGIFMVKPLLETTEEEWDNLMKINVKGSFLGMKHVIPIMLKHQNGSIINASANSGLFGASGLTLYGASKGAVRIMTKAAAMEYAQYYIRINSIHPGYINTQMIEYASMVSRKSIEDQGKLVPLRRIGNTLDVANMVLYLASNESTYVTGAEFVLDGGVSAGQSIWQQSNA